MDVKILEPITKYIKEFATVDEFNMYYAKNKKEIDENTTHKLNKMYKIDGYRITKINGTLMLKKYDEKHDKRYVTDKEIMEIDIKQQILQLKQQYTDLRETVNNIIKFLNHNGDTPND